MMTYLAHPNSRRRLHTTRSAVWVVLAFSVAGTAPSYAESLPSIVKRAIQAGNLCSTIEFDGLEVDVKDGLTRRSAGFGERVRKGERLVVGEVDISRDGLELEIELKSEGGRGGTIDVEVRFHRSIRGVKNQLINEEDLWRAVGYFAGPCPGPAGSEKSDASLSPVEPARARAEGRDPCVGWTLEGYSLGMNKAEALSVRPARPTKEREFTAQGEVGRFHYALLHFTKDERLSGVFIRYAVSKKKELEALTASFTESFGKPALENVRRVSGILPYTQTVWGSPDCDAKVYVNAFSTFGFVSDVYAGLTTALGGEPATPVTDIAERLQLPGYSIQPPPGQGWIRSGAVPPRERVHALFYRQTFKEGHSIVAKVGGWVLEPPPEAGPGTPADRMTRFLDATDLVADTKRFKPVSVTSSADSSLGFECRRFDQIVNDRGVPGANGAAYPFENHGYVCAHPDFPHYLVSIDYSQRRPPGVEPYALEEAGEGFLKSLVLEPLGVKIDLVPVGKEPQFMIQAHGSVWVSHQPQAVSRIDPKTRTVLGTIKVGNSPAGMAASEEAVWVVNYGDRSVSRIDPARNQVVATIKVGKNPLLIGTYAGSLWVTDQDGGSVTRIDPKTNRVLAEVRVGKSADGLASGGGGIYVSVFDEGIVCRIDPSTNKVVSRFKVGSGPGGMLYAADQLWVANQHDDAVVRVDPVSGKLLATVGVGRAPHNVVLYGGTIWVANAFDNALSVIDPEENRVVGRAIPLGDHPQGFLEVDGELWVTNSWGSSIARLTRNQ